MSSDLVLNGRYRLVERIASGGMGEVWQASDEVLGREVAVKLLKHQYVADESFRARFRAEAQYAARLSHPGIAQVYDFGEQNDLAFLVMELVRGDPLSAILERSGRLTSEVTLDLVSQAARALQTAHDAGIIHRDIKPGNLMVTSDGRVKITDFGIARATQANTLTQTGMVMGTAQYVSPEQASGKTITAASDIYSLGVVAYECLAGEPPFTAEQPLAIALAHVRELPPELPDDVSQPVSDLVTQSLAKDPQERPATAVQFADSAQALLEGYDSGMSMPPPTNGLAGTAETMIAGTGGLGTAGPTTAQPTHGGDPASDRPHSHRPLRSRRRLIAASSLGVVVVVLGFVLANTMWPDSSNARYSGNTPQSGTSDSASPAATPTMTRSTHSRRPSSRPTAHTAGPRPSTAPTPTRRVTSRPTTPSGSITDHPTGGPTHTHSQNPTDPTQPPEDSPPPTGGDDDGGSEPTQPPDTHSPPETDGPPTGPSNSG